MLASVFTEMHKKQTIFVKTNELCFPSEAPWSQDSPLFTVWIGKIKPGSRNDRESHSTWSRFSPVTLRHTTPSKTVWKWFRAGTHFDVSTWDESYHFFFILKRSNSIKSAQNFRKVLRKKKNKVMDLLWFKMFGTEHLQSSHPPPCSSPDGGIFYGSWSHSPPGRRRYKGRRPCCQAALPPAFQGGSAPAPSASAWGGSWPLGTPPGGKDQKQYRIQPLCVYEPNWSGSLSMDTWHRVNMG